MSTQMDEITSLPRPMTRFVGRQDEIESICALLMRDDVRLVTLTGAGGIGKTRLSIEVARRLEHDSDLKVRFVTLATVSDPGEAIRLVAGSLGLWNSKPDDAVQRLFLLLEHERILLIVDNLEHVIDIAGDLGRLLAMTTGLKLLATSRSPLHIQGEREYSVPQLTIPATSQDVDFDTMLQSEAVELFIDRARTIHHEFDVDHENARAVASICARLDGLPLAIELAAARTRALPPIALAARLDNQLELLRSDSRDAPQRLRTIRATIDWSFQLLGIDEQRALLRLSVFSGDFPFSGAASVLDVNESHALDMLESLIEKSLLLTRQPSNDEPHYRMLSAVRQFGLEQLEQEGELQLVREQLARWAAELCELLFEAQFAANQHDAFARLDRIHETIRQSLAWAMENDQWDYAARIAANLWQYWDISGNLGQGRIWMRRIIQQDRRWPEDLIPKLYYGFAILAGSIEDANENEQVGTSLLETYGDSADIRIRAVALNMIGLCSKPYVALNAAREATELWRDAGETVWYGLAAGLAGRWAREIGDLEMSASYSQLSYDVLKSTGHLWGIALALQGLGRVHHLRGDIDRADAIYRRGLSELVRLGDRILVLRYFEFLIEIAAHRHQWERAIQLAGAASRMRTLMGYELRYSAEAQKSDELQSAARERLGKDAFDRARATGEKLSLSESIALALDTVTDSEQTQPAVTSRSAGLLTRRESEVLRRIVAGKTDQAIADELFVSYRTVTTHVTNILNKLGADSRTEAAAIAVREHLVDD